MIFAIELTEQAEKDLREIYEYIAFQLLAPENAAGQIDRLEAEIMSLSEFPLRYKRYDKEPWHSRGLRLVPVDNYIIFFVPDEELGIVTVIRVMYTGRNIKSELQDNTDFECL